MSSRVSALRALPPAALLQTQTLPDAAQQAMTADARPRVAGKFIYVGRDKFYVKGVTYGAFKPDADKREYHDLARVDADFRLMSAFGINTVRVPHTLPPRALLDIAQAHGLRVMVGLSAEQYVGYLLDRQPGPDIAALTRDKVRAVAGHPALLCYAIGNEIAAPVARWLGARRVERYLYDIYRAVKTEDPQSIVTYVNYPSTEYLDLSFLDALSFNVYLESPDSLKGYLARLQNIAGDRPLLMSELGLDALRNGELRQAQVLDWQVRTSFAGGCAGVIVFSWTDEWHRAGAEVEDWAFGLTTRDRQPKPALVTVRDAFADTPFETRSEAPRVSVIICSYNGARTIGECLDAVQRLRYPNYEVIVVDDGSTDATAAIASRYAVQLISTSNHGLSHARNVGLAAARGEIVAYIDDDAYPDEHWLDYLADAFSNTDHVGIGGPNIPPTDDGLIAACVANAPGGPVHVLLTDEIAEHIPGCNMAFRRAALQAIGGFDAQFRAAGDDVDLCWRLQEAGGTLAFCPGAMVWHHRRNSVRGYWRQQRGYGQAEAMLEGKWPQKYNSSGHHTFAGRIYGKGLAGLFKPVGRIYHGVWGSAPFQSLYQPAAGAWQSISLMPEWYLLLGVLLCLALLATAWAPLFWVVPLMLILGVFSVAQAVRNARQAVRGCHPSSARPAVAAQVIIVWLHLTQPMARLWGRMRGGLTLWRHRVQPPFAAPYRREFAVWTEDWMPPEKRLDSIDAHLRGERNLVLHGDEFSRWDLEVRGGMFGGARLMMAVEDHGAGTQYVRLRLWPRCRTAVIAILSCGGVLAAVAALETAWAAAIVIGAIVIWLAVRTAQQCGGALASLLRASAAIRQDVDGVAANH